MIFNRLFVSVLEEIVSDERKDEDKTEIGRTGPKKFKRESFEAERCRRGSGLRSTMMPNSITDFSCDRFYFSLCNRS